MTASMDVDACFVYMDPLCMVYGPMVQWLILSVPSGLLLVVDLIVLLCLLSC